MAVDAPTPNVRLVRLLTAAGNGAKMTTKPQKTQARLHLRRAKSHRVTRWTVRKP